jgi:aspartate kinase
VSVSLLAMAIENMGFPAISLTGWQAGFKTDSAHGSAQITEILTGRIKSEISKKNIVIVAGFQGIDENKDITTLGRGGSDTSAVALAAAINADVCKIYTDVDGVYTADPRIVPSAKKLSGISYDEMFELSYHGAQVLNDRSIITAKHHSVEIEVLSSMVSGTAGTFVKNITEKRGNAISGIAVENNIVKISVTNVGNKNIFADKIFPALIKTGVKIDTALAPIGQPAPDNVVFTVPKDKLSETIDIIEKHLLDEEYTQIFYDKNKSKISVINLSENININIASIIFETLSEANIDIEMVACNSTRVSVLVSSNNMHAALNSIHSKLFEEDNLL